MNIIKCKRCGHLWSPRTDKPAMCPRCKSYEWNKEKKKDSEVED